MAVCGSGCCCPILNFFTSNLEEVAAIQSRIFFSADAKEGTAVQTFFSSVSGSGRCCSILKFFFQWIWKGELLSQLEIFFFRGCGRGHCYTISKSFFSVNLEESAADQSQNFFFQRMWKRALLTGPQSFFLCGFGRGHCYPTLKIFSGCGRGPYCQISKKNFCRFGRGHLRTIYKVLR